MKEDLKDGLEVENYSPYKLKSKKRNIATRVAIAGIVVGISMGIAGLVIKIFYPDTMEKIKDTIQSTINGEDDWNANVLGGSGSWFLSRLERLDG